MSPLYFRNSYRNSYRHTLWIIFVLTVLTTVLACSGGESGTGAQPEQTTVGEITGFGSIYVKGIHFDTNQLESIEVDDDTNAVETDLEVGMVVTIVGTVSADGTQGVARQILMTTAVEGLVFSTNLPDSINVMGQTVNITNDTHFNSNVPVITDFDGIVANQTAVEVHGYTDGLGVFFATMVKVVQNNGVAPEVRLLGRIQNYAGDAMSGSFNIGSITVRYDGSTSFDDGLQVSELANDLYVEVESNNYSSGSGDVLASEIERADLNESEGGGYELEGIVTDTSNLVALNEFSLNGQRVVLGAMTVFEGGSSSNIEVGVELEVEGVYQNGALQAHEISFHVESDMELTGVVDSISGNTLRIIDSDTMTLVAVTVNELTSYEDEVDEMNIYFSFDDVTQGMTLKVKYYEDTDSMQNIATQIDRTGS